MVEFVVILGEACALGGSATTAVLSLTRRLERRVVNVSSDPLLDRGAARVAFESFLVRAF